MKKFHDALKIIYGPKSSKATTLLSVDGSTLLIDKEAWKGGQNASIVCPIDHKASMRMQPTDIHR